MREEFINNVGIPPFCFTVSKLIIMFFFCRCLEHFIANTDVYTDVLQYLPIHIKTRILKRLTLTANHANIKHMLQMLVHSQLKQIDFSLNNVDDELLKIISCCCNLRELILTRTRNDVLTAQGNLVMIFVCNKLYS